MAGSYLPSLFPRRNDGLGSLFREIERTFDDFSRRSPLAGFAGFGNGAMIPKIDVAEGKDAIEVLAELPGCSEKDIDITLSEGVLTIRGEKKTERDETDKEKNWHMVERSYGSFQSLHLVAVQSGSREGRSKVRQRGVARETAEAG